MTTPPPPFPDSPGPHVKVCGLARAGDALHALDCGAAFLGIILARKSPRFLDLDAAEALVAEVRRQAVEAPRFVGVFVEGSPGEIAAAATRLGLAAVQLHKPMAAADRAALPVPAIPTFRMRGPGMEAEIRAALGEGPVLLDAYHPDKHGGVGQPFDHDLAMPLLGAGRLFIAGGLKPETIGATAAAFAARGAQPYAYDASSGLESAPGVKDHARVAAFFDNLAHSLAETTRP